MPESFPIKADLFRFATGRAADLISTTQSQVGFVHHPDLSKSVLRTCPPPTQQKRPTAVAWMAYLAQFKTFADRGAVRAFKPELYDIATSAPGLQGTSQRAQVAPPPNPGDHRRPSDRCLIGSSYP